MDLYTPWDYKLEETGEVNPPRYPRVEGRETIIELILRYPLPPYNPLYDGSHNPGEAVLDDLVQQPIETLRQRCIRHGLLEEGTRFELAERLYRHWRAARLALGFPLYGYGPGYEKVCTPSCCCGSAGIRKEKSMRIPRFPREAERRFPRTCRWPRIPRFPRTRRFPRLEHSADPMHNLYLDKNGL